MVGNKRVGKERVREERVEKERVGKERVRKRIDVGKCGWKVLVGRVPARGTDGRGVGERNG